MFHRDDLLLGQRRYFLLRVLRGCGRYPNVGFRARDALYVVNKTVAYTVVPGEPPNEYGWSEIAWNEVGEIRLWGALALSIREGQGFYTLCPSSEGKRLYLRELREDIADRVAMNIAAKLGNDSYEVHWIAPSVVEISALYDALLAADAILLRGVNCFLKSLAIWHTDDRWMLMEEIGINLYIALEAGLSVLRRRLSVVGAGEVTFQMVYDFLSRTFQHGETLVAFWKDRRNDRNVLLHADSQFGPYAVAPMSADDIYELLDPMLSLYRYILVGEVRPV